MRTIEKQVFYFAGLLVTVQLVNGSALPTKTVTELMVSDAEDKLGLVKYFKELEVDKFCKSQVLDDENFKTYEGKNSVPCLCTVIYRMNKELTSCNINTADVESAKNKTNDFKLNDVTYKIWKNVSKTSPSLKLLMDPLANVAQWNAICYDHINKDVQPYCKFLNVEVLLLYNFIQTSSEPIKENSVKTPGKVVKQEISNVISKDKKKLENLPETNVIGSVNKELNTEDVQKLKDEDSNEEEQTDSIFNKEDPMNNEDELGQEKPIDVKNVEISTEPKIDLQSNNDDLKEDDGTIIHTENKENQLIFNHKNTFPNNEFGDTEDSHFLFYFGMMTVLSMMFYLALYNKKKIIALLIEGRRSTNHRRRPNTASYSKVETDDGSTVF